MTVHDAETPDLRDVPRTAPGVPGVPGVAVAPGIADRLASLFHDLTGAPPPVRLRAWDDSVTGPGDAPELLVTSPAALRRLAWRPNELGLAQAYVTGELDVRGDVADGLRRVWRSSLGAAGRRTPAAVAARALRPGTLYRAGWEVLGVQALRPHYVRTVRAWLATLEDRWTEIVDLAGVEVARVWRLYLAGAALAFEDGRMGVDQVLAVRPDGMDR